MTSLDFQHQIMQRKFSCSSRDMSMWTTSLKHALSACHKGESSKTLVRSYAKRIEVRVPISTSETVSPPSPIKRSSSNNKSVSFSSTVQTVEYEPDVNQNMFYTQEDYALMKLQRKSDIYFLHCGGCCHVDPTGLETYVSDHIRDKTIRHKRKYVAAVMEEYKRQCECGVSDPTLLGCIARDSSKWCMRRALKVGSYQSRTSQGPYTYASRAA